MGIEYRRATTEDVDGIAALHADSWRRNYRGAYSDSYLDGDVLSERVATWTERLSATPDDTITIVAEQDASVVGFAHTVLDADPEYGALVDNLHVTHALKASAIGTDQLSEAACAVLATRPQSGVFLWVLEHTKAAEAFYEARAGERGDRRLAALLPRGGRAYTVGHLWADPSVLV